ncbi:MAG: hypothetical protein J7K23_01625 [Thermoproteales archaeon]|nr:hypothetical protein [Thermoproteales archaeon]
MDTNDELELLKMRKLLELQKKLLMNKTKTTEKKDIDLYSLFYSNLTESGRKMFNLAKSQYPTIAEKIAKEIGRLLYLGRIQGKFDDQTIYGIFYELGFPIRIETKIVYKKKGEVKSISELIKGDK